MSCISKYRCFISYSHENSDLYSAVHRELENLGLMPVSDASILAGKGFTEEIQDSIEHSHLFVPILTPESHRRGWVHQEIGYAVAMRVPCVPICVGQLPAGMISMAQALKVKSGEQLEAKLRKVKFEQLVQEAGHRWIPPSGCAVEPEERAEMIERFADRAYTKFGASCVRIQGGLTSLSLPDEPPDHPSWEARYGDKPRSPYAYGWFRRERNALARHASDPDGGLRIIVNVGVNPDPFYGEGVKRTRLSLLVRFLESLELSADAVTIALVSEPPPELLLSVGDWFVAESMADRPVRGVLQTVFTSHAPTVSRKLAEFDHRLDTLVRKQGSPPGRSKEWAIEKLLNIIRELPRHPAWSATEFNSPAINDEHE